jgi:hypothetical protein
MDTAPAFIALLTFAVWVPAENKQRSGLALVSGILKIAIVFLCFSLCGASTFIVSTPRAEKSQGRTNVTPVKNRQLIQRSWTQV